MTQTQLIDAFNALRLEVTPKAWDGVFGDQVVTTYGVQVTLSGTGSMVVRTIRESDQCDPAEVAAEMRLELAGRAKGTRARIRRERSAT